MNTNGMNRSNKAQWIRSGLAALGGLLITGAVSLGLANQIQVNAVAMPMASVSTVSPTANTRFMAHKQWQLEQIDAPVAGVGKPSNATARLVAHKHWQIDSLDTQATNSATLRSSAATRFADFKDRQIEQINAR